jgi:predicted transcriptional regulator
MKRIPRRDKLKIYGDLLTALHNEARSGKVVLTRVQVQINVPFDRLKTYLSELAALGLIESEASPRLTDKGIEYLREYRKVLEFIRRMGIEYG